MSASRIDQKRTGVSGGLQYKPTDNFELKADALYSKIKITEVQDQTVWGANNWGNWNMGDGTNTGWNDGDYQRRRRVLHPDQQHRGRRHPALQLGPDRAGQVHRGQGPVRRRPERQVDQATSGPWPPTPRTRRPKRTNTWKAVRFEAYPTSTSFDWRAGKTPTITTSQRQPQPQPDRRPGRFA
jgi:iron complex outermembrane receptor protein